MVQPKSLAVGCLALACIALGCGSPEARPDASLSSDKELLSLSFRTSDNPMLAADVTAAIESTTARAAAPFGTALTSLIATFTTTGARVEVSGVPQDSGMTPNDFSSPITYRVVAEDGSSQDYVVIVIAPRVQQAYIKAPATHGGDAFGMSVSLTSDGTRLAVGAGSYPSPGAGAVFVFSRAGTTWTQEAMLTASNADLGDLFGVDVALAEDGMTLAIGAERERSAASGVNGDASDNSLANAGAVYVFTRSGTTWAQQAYLKASSPDADDDFGRAVAISQDGNTLAVGAVGEDS